MSCLVGLCCNKGMKPKPQSEKQVPGDIGHRMTTCCTAGQTPVTMVTPVTPPWVEQQCFLVWHLRSWPKGCYKATGRLVWRCSKSQWVFVSDRQCLKGLKTCSCRIHRHRIDVILLSCTEFVYTIYGSILLALQNPSARDATTNGQHLSTPSLRQSSPRAVWTGNSQG